MDEGVGALMYFKCEGDVIAKRPPFGSISLSNATISLADGLTSFILHCSNKQQYEFETENEMSALVWMNSLQKLVSANKTSNGLGSFQNARLKRTPSTVSLPTDMEMADLLDSAFKSSFLRQSLSGSSGSSAAEYIEDGSSIGWENGVVDSSILPPPAQHKTQCVFYFNNSEDEALSEDEVSDSDQSQPSLNNKLAGSKAMKSAQPESSSIKSASNSTAGQNLQHWIRDWLKEQQLESTTSERRNSTTESNRDLNNILQSLQSVPSLQHLVGDLMSAKHEAQVLKTQKDDLEQQVQRQEQLVLELCKQIDEKHGPNASTAVKCEVLQSQNRILNEEIIRLASQKNEDPQSPGRLLSDAVERLESQLEQQKRDYVFLLQSCVRIPLAERSGLAEVRLFGGDKHRERVAKLIEEARTSDPTLPSFDNLSKGGSHMDVYGFQHSFNDQGLLLHYLCTELHNHYNRCHQQYNKQRWKLYLKSSQGIIINNKDTRQLVRDGIPAGYRSSIWKRLIHQQVADTKQKHGKYYYRNLISSQPKNPKDADVAYHKQITLDLLRTMPSNIHFSSPTCRGVSQIQEVLTAFCAHNPTLGYCQGMNFIVGTALLFLSPEDAFWLLIAITEKYFDPSYFDQALSGAQADQEVLKELLEEKLPDLYAHLHKSEIDVATITFNWFLALYFDCLPFETMLRVWDTFLLEGPKVLFRFALAIMILHRETLMERSDTISIMKILKAAAKYTYDAEGLVKIAFETMKPFPNRKRLAGRQTAYLKLLQDRFRITDELKAAVTDQAALASKSSDQALIELAITFERGQVLIISGHQTLAKLAVVDLSKGSMKLLSYDFECRVVAASARNHLIFLSLLSRTLVCFDTRKGEATWETQLREIALSLKCYERSLFAGLANGSFAVIENVQSDEAPCLSEVYYIPIGPAPVSSLCSWRDQIWCAIASKAIILNIRTLDILEEIHLAANVSGGSVSFFERVNSMYVSPIGIWLTLQKASLVQLWDPGTFTAALLYDVAQDYYKVSSRETVESVQVTTLLFFENSLWIGTADGYVIVYEVKRKSNLYNSRRLSNFSHSRQSSFEQSGHGHLLPPGKHATSAQSLNLTGSGHVRTTSTTSARASGPTRSSLEPIRSVDTEDKMRDSGYSGVSSNLNRSHSTKVTSTSARPGCRPMSPNISISSSVQKEAGMHNFLRALAKTSDASNQDLFFRAPVSASREELMALNSPSGSYFSPSSSYKENMDTTHRNRVRSGPPTIAKSFSVCTGHLEQNMEKAAAFMEAHAQNKSRTEANGHVPTSPGEERTSGRKTGLFRKHKQGGETQTKSDLNLNTARGRSQSPGGHHNEMRSKKSSWADERQASLRSCASMSSVLTTATYEFDDLMIPYEEERISSKPGGPGGLASSQLARCDSGWSIQSDNLSESLLNIAASGSGQRKSVFWGTKYAESLAASPGDSIKIRRKDLDVEEFFKLKEGGTGRWIGRLSPEPCASDGNESDYWEASDTASVLSFGSVIDTPFIYELSLQMMLKISDKPVNCLTTSRHNDKLYVISCAGNFGEEESVLRWHRESDQKLWTNDPIIEEAELARQATVKKSPFSRLRLPRSVNKEQF